jgi:hypothetical protein
MGRVQEIVAVPGLPGNALVLAVNEEGPAVRVWLLPWLMWRQ